MNIPEEYYTKKINFMQSLLTLLPFNEWNNNLLAEAEEQSGFASGYNTLLFPNGLQEVIDFFESRQDDKMLMQLAEIEAPKKIRDKLSLALKIRIKNCPPIIHSKNAAYFAMPSNILFATNLAMRSCDIIWRYAGDKSLDYNYYTKRGLLFTVYLPAILYYIQDESENYIETDKFIDESLTNVINGFTHFKNLCKLAEPSNIPIIRLFV
ncbi:COQ9 family protein [Rickettsia endosymbiont of Polydrusus tereticollis]|uniref:COQ9 family protein n=1 Tax=Rickettsia endosymbiont of Polydrusus tereticollis TaxID=3066251 RepID=UPI00313311BD